MWRGDIYIYYKEGVLPETRSGDTLCFVDVEAPNRDMALMQVIGTRWLLNKTGAPENYHPECANAPSFDEITGFKFRSYGKKRKRLTNL